MPVWSDEVCPSYQAKLSFDIYIFLATEEAGSSGSIFGGAKPVDTAAREREIEEKIAKEKQLREEKIAKEKELREQVLCMRGICS